MNIIRERNASAFLLLNAVLWGSSYIWSKMLLSWLPFFTILFVFSFAGLIVLSILFYKRIAKTGGRTILKGVGISGTESWVGLGPLINSIFRKMATKPCGFQGAILVLFQWSRSVLLLAFSLYLLCFRGYLKMTLSKIRDSVFVIAFLGNRMLANIITMLFIMAKNAINGQGSIDMNQ